MDVPCDVEEKVDGSQFSFGVFGSDRKLKCRSRSQAIDPDRPDGMFRLAVETVKELTDVLTIGWTYRAEVLCKSKHNILQYERTPKGNLILFDIQTSEQDWASRAEVEREASRIGLEVVPLLFSGKPTLSDLERCFNNKSILGGPIEGFVIKPIGRVLRDRDNAPIMAKWVSSQFKETKKDEWKEKPPRTDIFAFIGAPYRTHQRWQKAVQHLAETSSLTGTPADIGPLIREVQEDVAKECKVELLEELWDFAWPQISRAVITGLPEWYKEKLAQELFEREMHHPDPNTEEVKDE